MFTYKCFQIGVLLLTLEWGISPGKGTEGDASNEDFSLFACVGVGISPDPETMVLTSVVVLLFSTTWMKSLRTALGTSLFSDG